jgi:hypothetical protein
LSDEGDHGAPANESFILTRQANYYNDSARQMRELEDTIKRLETIYFSHSSVEYVDKDLLMPFPNPGEDQDDEESRMG